jgi:catechol 2,3-dioxygenase-like lactoylglutathione lyase family enzyme
MFSYDREYTITELRKNNRVAPSLRVQDMQKSLDWYTKTLGFKTTDKLTRRDGKIVHASVGFDSSLILLSPVENVRTPQTREDLAKNKQESKGPFETGLLVESFLNHIR